MMNTKKKSRISRVDPFFIDVADDYAKDIEKNLGIPISRPQASKHIAQAFNEMRRVNGTPIINKKGGKRGKKKYVEVIWGFEI